MSDELLTTGDVAKMLGVSTETIRRWVRNGAIDYAIVGNNRLRRTIRIRKQEAEKHIKEDQHA